ncbi:MAG: GFA family protein [Gammaproteobacteria bacterium]|nr:GFA family protein [Gammaproteobacteria bacterium]
MGDLNLKPKAVTGGCLCGRVRYRIHGQMRDIIDCHCENCRKTHGHYSAYTAVLRADIIFLAQQSLNWYHDVSPNTYRGFCNQCGASLLWDSGGDNGKISVSAGSLDAGHGLQTIAHIYMAEAGEYYEVVDNLPQYSHSSMGELESKLK